MTCKSVQQDEHHGSNQNKVLYAMKNPFNAEFRWLNLKFSFGSPPDILRLHHKRWVPNTLTVCAAILIAGLAASVDAHAGPWTLSQFSNLDPVLFNNWDSTMPPSIPGLTFSRYPAEVTELTPYYLVDYGLAGIALENTSGDGPNGYSYLDISFNPPQQAVGGFPFGLDSDNIGSVTEIVYDENTNVIESASITVPQYQFGEPSFLGIGETTTNICKVEWRYDYPGFFGVGNIIYQPGPPTVLSNVPAAANNISFQFQPLPGHTSSIQIATNLSAANWVTLSNFTFVGVGALTTITVPITNGVPGFFRVVAQ